MYVDCGYCGEWYGDEGHNCPKINGATCDDCKSDFDLNMENGYASEYLTLCQPCNYKRQDLEKAARA